MTPIAEAVFGLVKGLISPVANYFKRKQETKAKVQDSHMRIMEAKTVGLEKRLTTGQEADIRWENTSIRNAGWKDEYWTIVISIPAVLCFVPTMAPVVSAGFTALATCPTWYQWALLISVGSAFGYRKIADFMALKKGE